MRKFLKTTTHENGEFFCNKNNKLYFIINPKSNQIEVLYHKSNNIKKIKKEIFRDIDRFPPCKKPCGYNKIIFGLIQLEIERLSEK